MRIWALICALLAAPVAAQEGDVLTALATGDLARAATDAPADALARIDAALSEVADLRAALELMRLRAQALLALGRQAEAGETLAEAARLAIRAWPRIEEDPVPLLDAARNAFEAAGQTERATEMLALSTQQTAGAERRARLDRLADAQAAAGDPAAAQTRARAALPDAAPATRSAQATHDVVEIFYATDRAPSGEPGPTGRFGAGRGELSYGRMEVTIPAEHRAGQIERPSIWRLEFEADPARHVTLRAAESLEPDPFWDALRARTGDPARMPDAFVFVHGYNVDFDAAARRTAQLAWDTGFAGVPVLFSWPSRGTLSGYIADTASVRLSGRRLAAFLEDLVARSGATTIHVVAHSMGNLALTDALELMATGRPGLSEPVFDQAIFAAPDVDAGLFAEMARAIRPLVRRMTLYGSEADWALLASRKLHGDAPRAGDGGAAALALSEIDTIDMSALGEDVLAHGYAVNDRSAMMDVATLFWRDMPPSARCGVTPGAEAGGVTVWDYTADACDAPTLIGLLAALDRAGVQDESTVAKVVAEIFGDAPAASALIPVVREMMSR